MEIPVIDIFAGPGGLGEGFSTFLNPETNKRVFKIALSIEKDYYAHQTLTIRSFYRQFDKSKVPDEYYQFIKGNISRESLFDKYPEQARKAQDEAWLAELGESESATSNEVVDRKIKDCLEDNKNWFLIGGPPCQAYSVVGRSRRQEKILDEKKDERVGLYKQYLRILAVNNPAVFIMENVKGLLSAKTNESRIFSKILNDLNDPVKAYHEEFMKNGINLECPGYRIYSIVSEPESFDLDGNPVFNQQDFTIHAEKHGVPQTRHRVILLGIRKDINYQPEILLPESEIPVSAVLSGLPKIRSGLSKTIDRGDYWLKILKKILLPKIISDLDIDVQQEIIRQLDKVTMPKRKTGGEYVSYAAYKIDYNSKWFLDSKIDGVCNHSSRGHMESDLLRYFFAACFAKVKKRSPKLGDFPNSLLPAHKNIDPINDNIKFADRFRVQLLDKPSKTITSHISKDGHYYIHPDPTQCRSLTVREAARIQTFPDNYFFYGPRTQQFHQVGNAVPPLLAHKIAGIVDKIFRQINTIVNIDSYTIRDIKDFR